MAELNPFEVAQIQEEMKSYMEANSDCLHGTFVATGGDADLSSLYFNAEKAYGKMLDELVEKNHIKLEAREGIGEFGVYGFPRYLPSANQVLGVLIFIERTLTSWGVRLVFKYNADTRIVINTSVIA